MALTENTLHYNGDSQIIQPLNTCKQTFKGHKVSKKSVKKQANFIDSNFASNMVFSDSKLNPQIDASLHIEKPRAASN
jgi:hypothetical protein